MLFAILAKCRSHEATRFSKNPSSAGVNRFAAFTEGALAVLPMRGASAAGGRPNARTDGVFIVRLGAAAISFALFFAREPVSWQEVEGNVEQLVCLPRFAPPV